MYLVSAATVASSFDLYFPSQSVNNYAKYETNDLSGADEVTVCFWMKTDDTTSKLSVVSYATSDEDNELLVYFNDVGDLCLYVGGVKK